MSVRRLGTIAARQLFGVLALAMTGSIAAAQADRDALGPKDGAGLPAADTGRVQAGAVAPDFTLVLREGGTLTLSQYRGKKDVVLVFYRGHWCPYCTAQLKNLKGLLDDNRKKDVELIALSIDNRELLQTMADKVAEGGPPPDIRFVSDSAHRVIDRYGLRNMDRSDGIPHPTTYVIDRGGVVRWKFTEVNYKIRPTNAMVLAALDRLGGR